MELQTIRTFVLSAIFALVLSDDAQSDVIFDVELNKEILEGKSCLNGDCQNTIDDKRTFHEKEKYLMDNVVELSKEEAIDKRQQTDDEIEAILQKLDQAKESQELAGDTSSDITDQINDLDDNVNRDIEEVEEVMTDYEFPTLVKVDPGEVGDEVDLELDDGVMYKRITRSVRPVVFEIPDFLKPEECDHIIDSAKKHGLDTSNLFGAEIKDELDQERNNSDISRISDQTWLGKPEIGDEFWNILHNRLARLTQLDIGMIDRAEPMQVVSYVPGGHYHAHIDTVEANGLPCCFQTRCGEKENTPLWSTCCRLCRFITVLYYLNDVEEGGETVFPLADMDDELYDEKFVNLGQQKWYNLSLYCHNSSLIVKPKRGTAIFWYNHFIDEETGYLGAADKRSHHGGCDLLKGSKWIANNWISGTTIRHKRRPSVFYNP